MLSRKLSKLSEKPYQKPIGEDTVMAGTSEGMTDGEQVYSSCTASEFGSAVSVPAIWNQQSLEEVDKHKAQSTRPPRGLEQDHHRDGDISETSNAPRGSRKFGGISHNKQGYPASVVSVVSVPDFWRERLKRNRQALEEIDKHKSTIHQTFARPRTKLLQIW